MFIFRCHHERKVLLWKRLRLYKLLTLFRTKNIERGKKGVIPKSRAKLFHGTGPYHIGTSVMKKLEETSYQSQLLYSV